jgi:hypothetical protein
MSSMMVGNPKAKKYWVAQTVFSVDLAAIKAPLLLIGHAADSCLRSPAHLMAGIAAKAGSPRRQVANVTGGPAIVGRPPSVEACEVGEAHDFVDQEAEIAAGILRFMGGGRY